MSDERRKEIRLESVNLINYSAVVTGDMGGPTEATLYSVLGTARTKDISAGGCKLVTTHAIPEGIELSFDMQLGDYLISCHGRVARVEETQPGAEWTAGVEFVDLSELAHDGIKLYLEFKDG
jgi:c-di-GMP-binding flagellar brake protein YcgR